MKITSSIVHPPFGEQEKSNPIIEIRRGEIGHAPPDGGSPLGRGVLPRFVGRAFCLRERHVIDGTQLAHMHMGVANVEAH